MTSPSKSRRVERLIGLCKLWGAVKYFHPYLAYRDEIDWDAALVAAIPQVSDATNTADYMAAVQNMLAALGDPATRVIKQDHSKPAPSSVPSKHESQPCYTFMPDKILMVKINHYQDLFDFFGAIEKLAAIKAEIPKAGGVLFDLRVTTTPLLKSEGALSDIFRHSEIATVLSSIPLTTVGKRFRMHMGFSAQKDGLMSGPYHSAFQVVDAYRISPAPEAQDIPIVFIINEWSELPTEALTLQVAGKAAIIAEGNVNGDTPLIHIHHMSLGEGIIAKIRHNEILYEDGSSGFIPDIVIHPTQHLGDEDPAFTTAIELLKDFKLEKMKRIPLPAYAAPIPEKAYPEMTFPSLEYRLLAAFRIWTIIHYFFPYKDLMEKNWDEVLLEFIPRMEQANSALNYHLTVAEMITHIHDSHGFVGSPVLAQHFGFAWPPIRLQIIENTPVITNLLDEEITKTAGVGYGDVIIKIDGENALEQIAKRAKYRAASTSQWQMQQATFDSLSGPEDSLISLTVRDRTQCVKEIQLPRKAEFGNLSIDERHGDVIKLLTEDIGYADLDRLEASAVDEMFEKFRNTKAIIFDMRGYPKGTAWKIAPRLTKENSVKAALFCCPWRVSPDNLDEEKGSISVDYTFEQFIPPTEKWRYKGKTVMLIDEHTLSQAEHTGLFLEAANQTKFIGSHTAGVNGDVTNFCVPGGIYIWFTGQSVRHIDGGQLQRIGLVPDIEVKPTIKGIQDGRDEVIEAAIEYLQREVEAAKH